MSVMTMLKSTKPPITFKEQHTYRKIKSIDIDLLTKDLAASDLCKHTPDKLNGLVDCLVKLGKIIRQTCSTSDKTCFSKTLGTLVQRDFDS
jgi:hypothetical protein